MTSTMTATHILSRCTAVSKWEALRPKHRQLHQLEVMVLTPMPHMVATRIMSPCGMQPWPNSSNRAKAKVSRDRREPLEAPA